VLPTSDAYIDQLGNGWESVGVHPI
jgi:hypothetical protein